MTRLETLAYGWSACGIAGFEMTQFVVTGGVGHLGMGLLAAWLLGLVLVLRA